MSVKIFYYNSEFDEYVPPEAPIETNLDLALERFQRISGTEDCFFGIKDSYGNVLQFAWNNDGSVTVDIPDPRRKGSFTRNATQKECEEIIGSLREPISPNLIPGLVFESWN